MKARWLPPSSLTLLSSVIVTLIAILVGSSPVQAKDQVDLQFWDMIWGPPEYIDAGKALVAQFNQEHPDITVTYRSIPWTNWYQTFVTAIGSGTAPDISTGAGYQAVQLYDQGAILPIDDLISQWKSNGKLDDFLPNTIDILKYDNHYVALPWAIDIRVWYYRKDLLAAANIEPPTSWDEFKNAAQAVTKPAADQYGVVACGDTLGSHYLYTVILNNGEVFLPKTVSRTWSLAVIWKRSSSWPTWFRRNVFIQPVPVIMTRMKSARSPKAKAYSLCTLRGLAPGFRNSVIRLVS